MIEPSKSDDTPVFLTIKYDGGRAESGTLPLDEYAQSLAGWLALTDLAIGIVLRNHPATSHLRVRQLLRIEIRAERAGSWEAVISFSQDLLPNVAWDAMKITGYWGTLKLIQWVTRVARRQTTAKRSTHDVDKIVAALEELAGEEGLELDVAPVVEDVVTL